MSRASVDALDALHALLAGTLKDELEAAIARSKPRIVDGTEKPGDPISPQLLDKVMKFLKDNGVDAPAKSARVSDLASTLGSLDLDEVAAARPN